MKNILTLLFISIFAFVGVESAKAQNLLIVFDENYGYIEQVPGNQVAKLIGTMYAGDTYTFYIATDDEWELNVTPPGLQISVNEGAYMPSYGYGEAGFSSVNVKADASLQGDYRIAISLLQGGTRSNYEILVLPKPAADGKFSCPTTSAELTPGSTTDYPNVVSLKVTGNPVLLVSGRVLGVADEGRIKIEYIGDPLVVTAGQEKTIPVRITVADNATIGTYEVPLDQVSNVESGCTWNITVKAPTCDFLLDCSNPLFAPNDFTENIVAHAGVVLKYTLSGCTTYSFSGIYNVQSTGVEGLTLNIDAKTLAGPSGNIVGVISGKPTSAGTATFHIPGYCSFSVTVKAGTPIFEVICNDNILTVCKPISCLTSITEYTSINYTLTSGTKDIPYWSGSKSLVSGLYAEVPAQTAKSPSGAIQVIIKGKPSKTGIIKVPVNIAGKVCYISVNMITTGDVILDCSQSPSFSTAYNKLICCKTVYMTYSLSCGTKCIPCWTGPKVNGVYASVPAQTLKATSSGKVKVYIKGCPTVRGTIKVPVTINGKTCYVDVNVN